MSEAGCLWCGCGVGHHTGAVPQVTKNNPLMRGVRWTKKACQNAQHVNGRVKGCATYEAPSIHKPKPR